MTRISYVNGDYIDHDQAMIHIEDRGCQFSDGVYEVISVRHTMILHLSHHVERLHRSLAGLKIKCLMNEPDLQEIIQTLLSKNGMDSAFLYLQITRGTAARSHAFPVENITPNVMMTVISPAFPSASEYKHGASAVTHPDLRWKRRDLKTISLLPNVLAKEDAVSRGAQESILIEEDGTVTEGSSTNFFIVTGDGVVRTHPANHSILGGITRMNIINLANDYGIELSDRAFSQHEMMAANEAFISSTTKHILPIVTIDGQSLSDGRVGPVTRRLMEGYEEFIDQIIQPKLSHRE